MNSTKTFGAGLVCLALAAGCGGGTNRESTERENGAAEDGNVAAARSEQEDSTGRPAPLSVAGCLTAANGRYVLTQLERGAAPASGATGGSAQATGGAAQTTTETYQLTNADDQLRQYVGRQVRVNGEAEPARVAEVRETTSGSAAPQGTTGQSGTATSAGQGQATVSTESNTRLEMRRVMVTSVTPTGDPCPAAVPAGAAGSPTR